MHRSAQRLASGQRQLRESERLKGVLFGKPDNSAGLFRFA